MATRWGIASAGRISHDFATAVGTFPKSEHELVAVAAQDLSRAKDFAKLHGMRQAYGSYEELAGDRSVEIVYIGSLNTTHFDIAKLMLNNGKHVLCEKPLTMNAKQTRELIELARRKRLFLMEAIWSRCFPAYDTLRRELEKKSIGEVKQVIVGLGLRIGSVDRLIQKKLGGGSVLDLGVYTIQFASLVFNHEKPKSINVSGHVNEDGVDTSMSATLLYSDGRTATMFTHAIVEYPNEAYVIGTKGTIHIPQFWAPPSITLPSGIIKVPLPESKIKFFHTNSAGLSYEAAEARECIKKGLIESPKVSHAHSVHIAELEDEFRRQLGVVYDVD